MRAHVAISAAILLASGIGCASGPAEDTPPEGIDVFGSTGFEDPSGGLDDRLDVGGGSSGSPDGSPEGSNASCEADLVGTELLPVSLAFAVDVSASMGNFDEPWYDPELKWQPVATAMEDFFGDPGLAGVQASMTFFPAAGDKCNPQSYATPAVEDGLPSGAFADALQDARPDSVDGWRSGTPTLAVSRATLERLVARASEDASTQYAFVLVSDGYPQGCGAADNDIQATVDLVSAHADDVPTYVVGVKNPPPGPDMVSDLDSVAAAGGSGQAFIVETGDPTATAETFADAIDAIRSAVGDCRLEIPPPPPGVSFDPTKVNVRVDGIEIGYDPGCAVGTGWRFDDANAPEHVVLCPAACELVQDDPELDLTMGFGCARNPVEG